jgi:hypothetical protein
VKTATYHFSHLFAFLDKRVESKLHFDKKILSLAIWEKVSQPGKMEMFISFIP